MKVLSAAAMREVDRRTIEQAIPGIVLMENAAHRVVEFLERRFAPISSQRIAVLCGKGNNGGDGLAIARQLFTRLQPAALHVVLFSDPADLKGDAAANYRMLAFCGCPVAREIPAQARNATLVVDALLGTGISGPATGAMLDAIREINGGFPLAKVVALDIPSGMPTDTGKPSGEFVRADATVTFTAPKPAHVLPPACDHVGELVVGAIGSPESLYADAWLSVVEPGMFRRLLAPRPPGGHKGTFGHVLVVAGSPGKTGAAAMSGLGALRAGAGLVTVASAAAAIPQIAPHAPELMTEALDGSTVKALARGKTVVAMGPGLGQAPEVGRMVLEAVAETEQPMVLDADALVDGLRGAPGRVRVLTPHPGEMARLSGRSTAEVQDDRVNVSREFARERGVTLVLKGERTAIAFADGRVWINPTGTPALGTGGSGDILTGLVAGFLAQFPNSPDEAVAAAVYLHGLAAQIGAREIGEKSLIATDILKYLPAAMEECAGVPHRL
jgi:ADP-dependent NAD(P)H-hydrate dehydratase / NAD(P)H-hydrate epimerase